MKYLAMATVLATSAVVFAGAQTPAISIRPTAGLTAGPSLVVAPRLGAPILGYVAGPGPLDLRVIAGTGKGAQLGSALAVPDGGKQFYLPPREHYLLLESNSVTEPLALWLPAKASGERQPLAGALAHPDRVWFSARGDAVVLYTRASDNLQIVRGLPAEPKIATHPGAGRLGEPAHLAVSDDGSLVAVSFADGTAAISSSDNAEWQRLPAAYGASALLFVPRSHDLVVGDAVQRTVTLISNPGEGNQAGRILLQNVLAESMAFTKEGTVLLAASASQGKIWMFDLKTMAAGPVSSPPALEMLLPLRDGHTFLLSSHAFALLSVPVDGENLTPGVVPVTH